MPRVRLLPEQRAALAAARERMPAQIPEEPVRLTNLDEDEAEREIRHARALDLELATRLRQIRGNVTASRGLAVDQAVAEAKEGMASAWNEIAGQATSSAMRGLLRDQFDRRAYLLQHDLSGHVARERKSAQRDNAARL